MRHEILIDGHNALHRLRLAGGGIEALRRRLAERVRQVAPRATVHFDGHPPAGGFGGTEDRGLTLRYSGDREADEAIVEHVRASRHPRRITVVTDDLGLARRAEQMGAATMRVGQFFAEAAAGEAPEKTAPGGFSAADFGLPEVFDLRAEPAPAHAPRRRPRLPRARP